MPTISIRLQDQDLAELKKHSDRLHMSRAEYIRQAVIAMNKKVDSELRRKQIMAASKRVRDESMKINAEFDALAFSLHPKLSDSYPVKKAF